MPDLTNLILLVTLGSIMGLIGGIAMLYIPKWSKLLEKYSIPFAVGVLLSVAILDLLPEAVDTVGNNAFTYTLISFFVIYLFEAFAFGLHHHDDDDVSVNKAPTYLVMVGDTIHNFIDGVAMTAAYIANPGLGIITAFTSFLHEVPHEIGDFGILLKFGWSKRATLLLNFVSALASFLGIPFVIILTHNNNIIGTLLSISAGIFLYLGASDFLPHVSEIKSDKIKSLLIMLLGILITLAFTYFIPHSEKKDSNQTGYAFLKTTNSIIFKDNIR